MAKAKYVEWAVDRDGRGYTVTVDDEDGSRLLLYQAGNHPGVSSVWLPRDDPKALNPDKLKELAYISACDTAKDYGLNPSDVYEMDDPYP